MQYCSECGVEVGPGAKFCPNCGASQHPLVHPESTSARVGTDIGRPGKRVSMLMSYVSFLAGGSVALAGVLFYSSPGMAEFTIGTIFLVAGALAILFGYGYRKARRWSWGAGLAMGAAFIVVGTMLATVLLLAGVGCIIFGSLSVSQMYRTEVKAWLGRLPPS